MYWMSLNAKNYSIKHKTDIHMFLRSSNIDGRRETKQKWLHLKRHLLSKRMQFEQYAFFWNIGISPQMHFMDWQIQPTGVKLSSTILASFSMRWDLAQIDTIIMLNNIRYCSLIPMLEFYLFRCTNAEATIERSYTFRYHCIRVQLRFWKFKFDYPHHFNSSLEWKTQFEQNCLLVR